MLFFFNDTATTEIYTLSLHDALPICVLIGADAGEVPTVVGAILDWIDTDDNTHVEGAESDYRSEEHTSELQSQSNLVCRLLLEKKKRNPHAPMLSTH